MSPRLVLVDADYVPPPLPAPLAPRPPPPPAPRRFDDLGNGWTLCHAWHGHPAELRHGCTVITLTRVRTGPGNVGTITLTGTGDLDELGEILVARVVSREPPPRR